MLDGAPLVVLLSQLNPPRKPRVASKADKMVPSIETLPKQRIFPVDSSFVPGEGEVFDAQLQALAGPPADDSKASQSASQSVIEKTAKETARLVIAENKRAAGQHHPAAPGHAGAIQAHQELRNLMSVSDRLRDVARSVSSAPQIQQATLDQIRDSMRSRLTDNILLRQRARRQTARVRELETQNAVLRRTIRNRPESIAGTSTAAPSTMADALEQASGFPQTSPALSDIGLGRAFSERGRMPPPPPRSRRPLPEDSIQGHRRRHHRDDRGRGDQRGDRGDRGGQRGDQRGERRRSPPRLQEAPRPTRR